MAITPKLENDVLKSGVEKRQYSIESVGSGMSTITEDMSVLDTVGTHATAELITNVGIVTCEHSKVGTVHNITSENSNLYNIRFTATDDYADGDTFTVNGASVSIKGKPGFKSGDTEICFLEGNNLSFNRPASSTPYTNVIWSGTLTTGSVTVSKDVSQLGQLFYASIDWIYCIGIRIGNNIYFYGVSTFPADKSQQMMSANFSISGNVWTLVSASNIRVYGAGTPGTASSPTIRGIYEIKAV